MDNQIIKLLITDNSSWWEENLGTIFEPGQFQLLTAETGEEALDLYTGHEPDIIILDLNLPDMSGSEIITYVRDQAHDSDAYIITLTPEDHLQARTKALNIGANDYLLKTFNLEEFRARMNVAKRQVLLNKQLRHAFERIASEIDTVASLQNKLLPKECLWMQNASIQSVYHLSGRASGDYYDFFPLDDSTIRAVIADVSGHGARAAFLMAIVRALIKTTQRFYLDLTQTLELVNKQLIEIIGDESDFITLFAADVDTKNNTLTYINAGHCPGILSKTFADTDLLEPTSTILGFFDLDFSPRQVDISDRCGLFLFTDGFYEWEVSPGQFYGLDNFLSLVKECMCKEEFNLQDMEQTMIQGLDFKPAFRDDRTALWIKWGHPARRVFRNRADPEGVGKVIKLATAFLQSQLSDLELINDLKLALTEACSNVALHAYSGLDKGEVEVQIVLDPMRFIRITIIDWGRSFPGPDLENLDMHPEEESGRGLFIISQLVDNYDYRNAEDKNILTLEKIFEE